MTMHLKLSDEQWRQVVDRLPGILGVRAQRDVHSYRSFIDDVLWVVGNDLVWHELRPATCGWRSVYMRFQRWGDSGVWAIVAGAIEDNPMLREALQRRLDEQQRSRERRLRRAPEVLLQPQATAAVQAPTQSPPAGGAQPVAEARGGGTGAVLRRTTGGPTFALTGAGTWSRDAVQGAARRRA